MALLLEFNEIEPVLQRAGNGYGRSAEGQSAGGARGESAHGIAEETEPTKGATSSRFVTGTMAMTGDCVATTEPVVEQTGQMCAADGTPVKSVQKWNCAPRKINPRNNAEMRMR
jgi:hypothetical protein